jgi:RNA polymerase sigma-70 factor (ECF subfamily)
MPDPAVCNIRNKSTYRTGRKGMPMTEHGPSSRHRFDDLDEPTIVARAQDGDVEAFEYLVDAYEGRLFRLAFRMLRDRGEAEDAVQETLIASWRKLPLLTSPRAFGGWVYQVVTNRCVDILRKRSACREDVSREDVRSAANLHPEADTGLYGREGQGDPGYDAEISAQMHSLAAVLDTLPADQRACWLLRELHGRSYTEIAAILKISESAVRGRLARARHHLAEGMSQWR